MLKPFFKRPVVLIAVVLVAAGIFTFVSFRRAAGPSAISKFRTADAPSPLAGAEPGGAADESGAPAQSRAEGLVYTHPKPYFSFRYPDGFVVSALPEDDTGQTVLARATDAADISNYRKRDISKLEFQIRISEFDEPGPITPERIKKDIPDMAIADPRTVQISGVPALTFLGENAGLGATREVWFVFGGNLYQITAYAEMDEVLGEILKTWEFQ